MPRFMLHVRPAGGDEQARSALARRYPEIDLVEIRWRPDGGEDWLCDAPDLTHVERWVAEQGVAVDRRTRWAEPVVDDSSPADGRLTVDPAG